MRRSGIYGRCSFRDDRSQAACCGERFCAVVTTADGSTGNTPEALNRLNSACALTRASKRVTAAVLQEERMRLATIAALTVLVALPADAVQQRYQTASLAPTCDNGARCTTINAAVPIAPDVMNALGSKGASAPTGRPVSSSRARPVRALASVSPMPPVSRPISMTLKQITAPACCSWAAFCPAGAHLPASIHVERLWMCASSAEVWSTGIAICLVALLSAR